MKAIYKYQLPIQETHILELPEGYEIIRVEAIDGLFFLWAIVNTNENHPKTKCYLEFYKTGQPFKSEDLESLSFLGTCKLFIGQELCLYVFENFKPLWT
ncbi:hypothetical protein SAMN04515674_105276 [Pseudarcicella hirudinis]|uniref:DUF7352 domain-containing protein n=1 Tax=Pseudarcicella hirudinis TaxID=1079859 RepID=A0A1I5SYH7_9BACT|nr:hypothetical protein [Pseudarcicella hirudinis]SFP75768.1 hypothetical protein SAMN04515674_105276 [Pseudarcicella hirudinis]